MRMELLQLGLRPEEKQAFQEAAALAGNSLAAWVGERLHTPVIRELESRRRPVPFDSSISLRTVSDG